MCVRNCLHTKNEKQWSDQLHFFVGTLGTLGQHEFAFGFCGSTRSLAGHRRAFRALLLLLQRRSRRLFRRYMKIR